MRFLSDCNQSQALARLGALVRELRIEHGLGTRALARRATVARSTIQRIEAGTMRARPITLAVIAWALDPDRAAELRERLLAAAEGCLAEDGDWPRYRGRRQIQGMNTGAVPLPRDWDRRIKAHLRASEARRRWYATVDRLCISDDDALFAEADKWFKILNEASKEAGGVIRIGDVVYDGL